MFKKIIFDVDQTLVDTSCLEQERKKRNWSKVYQLIPQAQLYDGMQQILEVIRTHNISVALVTTTPRPYVERVARHFHIPYDHIVAYHDATPKPSPQPMLLAMQLLNAKPYEVLSFGDREIDIRASNAAGIESVACFWGTLEPTLLQNSGYRYAIKSPKEILSFIC